MALTSGTRLGPYEILAPIGAGGMGEVYQAKDTRLDRIVAIKVLPEHFAQSPERKQRFEREAKAISQLNHPHICTLYDVGEQDGIDFLVMEYIEGDTLAERLSKGALPLDQALEYGTQIADGLDTAHRAGIVHRDLKPGNIMLTKPGIKLLDFGLAKMMEEQAASDASDAPTQQKNLTHEEAIIGTLQYMAPEQLERQPADARTDIFAFGAVFYEMLTGSQSVRRSEPSEPHQRNYEGRAAADVGTRADSARAAGTYRGSMPGEGSGRTMAERGRSEAAAFMGFRRGRGEGQGRARATRTALATSDCPLLLTDWRRRRYRRLEAHAVCASCCHSLRNPAGGADDVPPRCSGGRVVSRRHSTRIRCERTTLHAQVR